MIYNNIGFQQFLHVLERVKRLRKETPLSLLFNHLRKRI